MLIKRRNTPESQEMDVNHTPGDSGNKISILYGVLYCTVLYCTVLYYTKFNYSIKVFPIQTIYHYHRPWTSLLGFPVDKKKVIKVRIAVCVCTYLCVPWPATCFAGLVGRVCVCVCCVCVCALTGDLLFCFAGLVGRSCRQGVQGVRVCALTGDLLCGSCRQGVRVCGCACVCPDRRLALRVL